MTARGNPEQVKDDYWALATKLRGTRAHVVLSLVFLVRVKAQEGADAFSCQQMHSYAAHVTS